MESLKYLMLVFPVRLHLVMFHTSCFMCVALDMTIISYAI